MAAVRKRSDFAANGAAFGVYVGIQQIVVMPTLAARLPDAEFGYVILFVSLLAIIANITGDELGNTMLARGVLSSSRSASPYFRIMLTMIVIGAVGGSVLLAFGVLEPGYLIVAVSTIIFAMTRYFLVAFFKSDGKFGYILAANMVYGVGAIAGLYLDERGSNLLPFLIGEGGALVFVLAALLVRSIRQRSRRGNGWPPPQVERGDAREYLRFAAASLIINLVTYLDRLVAVPLVGAQALGIYYAASTMSKSLATLVNPAAGVLLARLSRVSKTDGARYNQRVHHAARIVGIGVAVVGLGVSYLGVALLYPKFWAESLVIIPIVSLASALSAASFLMKPAIMRFFPASILLQTNVAFGAAMAILVVALTWQGGLLGFCVAILLARALQVWLYSRLVSSGADERAEVPQ